MNMLLGDYGSDLCRYLPDSVTSGRSEDDTVFDDLNSEIINSKVKSSANLLSFVSTDQAEFGGNGILNTGLQDGLMQIISPAPGRDPVIRVFPAWGKNKPAYFKLYTKGGFLVSSSAMNSEVFAGSFGNPGDLLPANGIPLAGSNYLFAFTVTLLQKL